MVERRDYLPVCNDQGVPLPDFQAMFCIRCVQPECSRSRAGGLFENRVASWEEKLFKSPPRMAKSDPLYAALAAKRFIEIDVSRVPEVNGKSDWVDPRSLDDPEPPTPKPRKAKPPKAQADDPKERPPLLAPAAKVDTPPTPRKPLNTTFQQGVLLGEPPAGKAPKSGDPWAAPRAASPPEATPIPVVQVGAKIRFK